ncbi:major royal jelly protein [Cryphonectria parasitica EP155]|uniref:Major royal jelly protein n=1 Tax=Cryphonectria parasitica (strain ATCC 38755 / EP155) TaxID=660469 RepID=A0A9P4XXM0_CRYP1|nr:major royal jelly protein [Cryphonectria parasitica EP155]KAF3762794.1 major royal jelly protein [Cryphonectria parasitica EP155]
MKAQAVIVAMLALLERGFGQNITFLTDSEQSGPPLETVHAYEGQWPTGIAVSSSGRMFSNYPGGLDPANVNNGSNNIYTVGELTGLTTEVAYPSQEMNNPPGGAINYTTTPPTGANYPDYLIGVQSVVVDPSDRLWILDTERVLTPDGKTLLSSSYGGPKLIGVDLSTNQVFQTILFPQTVALPDSYLNDVRFDLRPNVTEAGKGVAYITDSSNEGRNGLIIVDLGTGESWRHVSATELVRPDSGFVGWVSGQSVYAYDATSSGATYFPTGSDGIALSADGESLFFGPLSARRLYSVPTSLLRDRSSYSELRAQQGTLYHGQKGFSDGYETDSNGIIYMGNFEQNAVIMFTPENGTVTTFVRDPRINWVDTFSTGTDGYLYFTVNQLHLTASTYPGTDRRTKPYALFRAKLPNGGSKVILT